MDKETHTTIQGEFLSKAMKKKSELTFYLMNGLPLKGRIKSFDNFTILIESEGKDMLIFKHAISTVAS